MKHFSALEDFKGMVRDPDLTLRAFLDRGQITARSLFYRNHLPLLLLYPLYLALCPYCRITGKHLTLKGLLIAPLLAFGFLILAAIYDKILEHAAPPRREMPGEQKVANIALFLHLPVSAAGIFFFVHPLAGYLLLLGAVVHSVRSSILAVHTIYGITVKRSIVDYLSAVLLLAGAGILFLVAFNLFQSVDILLHF